MYKLESFPLLFYRSKKQSKKFLKAINSYCWFKRQTNTRTKTKRTFYYLASTEGKPRQWCTTLSSRLDTESLSTFVRLDEKKVFCFFLPFFISYYVVLKFCLGIIQALFVLSICSFFFHLSYDYFSLFVWVSSFPPSLLSTFLFSLFLFPLSSFSPIGRRYVIMGNRKATPLF